MGDWKLRKMKENIPTTNKKRMLKNSFFTRFMLIFNFILFKRVELGLLAFATVLVDFFYFSYVMCVLF